MTTTPYIKKMYDLIIIGGGAAGMFCAASAAKNGLRAAVAEKNRRPGMKLSITGKGRCNLTNNSDNETIMKNIPRNPRFMYSALSGFSAADTMEYFESIGVPLKTERGRRVFPVSDKAEDVTAALEREMKRHGVTVLQCRCTDLIIENGVCTGVITDKGRLRAKTVVLAAGGMSYPRTGSDGSGYKLAEKAGHTIEPPLSSLVPMVTEERWVSLIAGLELRNISMKLTDKNKTIYEDFGELMFTAFGIGGPVILSASAHIPRMETGRYSVKIDLKPALSEKKLDQRILRDFSERAGKPFCESLRGLLPARLDEVIVKLSGIPPEMKVDEVTREQRRTLIDLLKGLTLNIKDFRPIEEAIITRGGVRVKEIDPATMESKLTKGLYFAGEIIDVDAFTGGFNLQIAFSTAFAAAKAITARLTS